MGQIALVLPYSTEVSGGRTYSRFLKTVYHGRNGTQLRAYRTDISRSVKFSLLPGWAVASLLGGAVVTIPAILAARIIRCNRQPHSSGGQGGINEVEVVAKEGPVVATNSRLHAAVTPKRNDRFLNMLTLLLRR